MTILHCKAKRQYLLDGNVKRQYLLICKGCARTNIQSNLMRDIKCYIFIFVHLSRRRILHNCVQSERTASEKRCDLNLRLLL